MSGGRSRARWAGPVFLALASAAAAPAAGAAEAEAEWRGERFLELLRTYPERTPELSLALAARLVDEGPFAERDRAEYWIGSASLSLGDRSGARAWFVRLARDYPDSPWTGRSELGLADAAAQERRYGEALAHCRLALAARDPEVRELARLQETQLRVLRARQRWAWAAGALAMGVGLWLGASLLRRRPIAILPLPAELRIAGPVLAVLAVLSLGQDPAPQSAVLQVACGGALLLGLSGLRLRAVPLRRTGRALHVLVTVGALFALVYVAVYRSDLVGMVQETLRAGAD
jgi:tetratricopeptide (TPR) repeat protein